MSGTQSFHTIYSILVTYIISLTWIRGGDSLTLCLYGCTCNMTSFEPFINEPISTLSCPNTSSRDFLLPSGYAALLLDFNMLPMPFLQTELSDSVNLTVLGLSHNHIYSLNDWTAYLPQLKILDLSFNRLDYLSNRLIRHAPNLISLSIVGNNLEVIEIGTFTGLTQLRYLNLSHNRVYEYSRRWCYDMPELEELDLSDNTITVLWDNQFEGCASLKLLSLSNNHVAHIYSNAFKGLKHLKVLTLASNHLHNLPITSFTLLKSISVIDLSSNYFVRIPAYSFDSLNVTILKLNSMRYLKYTDENAFYRLLQLNTLEMRNNPELIYIDESSLKRAPNLKTLTLSDNDLFSLQNSLVKDLPSLTTLDISGNNFFCDCSMKWITDNGTNLISSLSNYTCRNTTVINSMNNNEPTDDNSTKSDGKFDEVHELDGGNSTKCVPRIVPFFQEKVEYNFGESIALQCRATGDPSSEAVWYYATDPLGNFSSIPIATFNRTVNKEARKQATNNGDLIINYLTSTDSGFYKCVGLTLHSNVSKILNLRVLNPNLYVIITHVTADSITVTWKRNHYRGDGTNDYLIKYRATHANSSVRVINIKPYMRTYTATHLAASSQYEFCITSQYQQHNVINNCTLVLTSPHGYHRVGLFNARTVIVGIGVSSVMASLLMSCGVSLCVRKYNVKKKKKHLDQFGDNSSRLCLSSVSDMSPVTYENKAARLCEEEEEEDGELAPVFDTTIDEPIESLATVQVISSVTQH